MKTTILTLALLLTGCAGDPAFEHSKVMAGTASQALQILDNEIAPAYDRAAETALQRLPAGARMADYNAAMAEWNIIEEGLKTAHSSLLDMQSALRAWEDGSQTAEGDYRSALACAVEGLRALADAADSLNIEVPLKVKEFLALGSIAAGECHGGT